MNGSREGLIPARAGNTIPCPFVVVSVRAHPRSRGEHPRISRRARPCWGSSPLARGTQPTGIFDSGASGLIPARAGNTVASETPDVPTGAHPRSRGEHGVLVSLMVGHWGSSPLARGTQVVLFAGVSDYGLIPARAGNTFGGVHWCFLTGAHPRSRGEHRFASHDQVAHSGSSPLARGTLGCCSSCDGVYGLIPARAGNTSLTNHTRTCRRAHPRSRGEHTYSILGNHEG